MRKRFLGTLGQTWSSASFVATFKFDASGFHKQTYRFKPQRWGKTLVLFAGGLRVLGRQLVCHHEYVREDSTIVRALGSYIECPKCGKQWFQNE